MLRIFSVSLATFLLPAVALAAFNDVTLTTDTVIQVGGYTLNVSGSSAVLQSIAVDTNSFTVTLASGSSAKISSPDLYDLSSDISSDVVADVCTGSESSLTLSYSGGGTVTNVITPSATKCTDPAATPTPSPSSSNSLSGSAIGFAPVDAGTPTIVGCPSGFVCVPIPAYAPSTIASSSAFSRNLQLGSLGADVKRLQQYLNAHGFTIAAHGPGSSGNETTIFGGLTRAALMKFQAANRISPAVGFFGPITRAFVASH